MRIRPLLSLARIEGRDKMSTESGRDLIVASTCPVCGKPVAGQDIFCSHCGSDLRKPMPTGTNSQEQGAGLQPGFATQWYSKPGLRSPKAAWLLILGGVGLVLIVVAILIRPEPENTTATEKTPAATWTATTTAVLTATPAAAPTQQTITAEVQASANQAFAAGWVVYLYDPEPKIVPSSGVDSTEITLRYVLSENANPVTNVVFILKSDATGAQEYVIPMRGSIEDWTSKTGQIRFILFNITRDMVRQEAYDPNKAVSQGFIGMTALYGPMNQQYVDNPVSLDIYLLAPEQSNGNLLISSSSKQLSNTVRIPVGQ